VLSKVYQSPVCKLDKYLRSGILTLPHVSTEPYLTLFDSRSDEQIIPFMTFECSLDVRSHQNMIGLLGYRDRPKLFSL